MGRHNIHSVLGDTEVDRRGDEALTPFVMDAAFTGEASPGQEITLPPVSGYRGRSTRRLSNSGVSPAFWIKHLNPMRNQTVREAG